VRNSVVVYSVRTEFPDRATRERYVDWLRDGGCLAVVRAGGALSAEVTVLETGAVDARFVFGSRADFDAYERGAAVELSGEFARLFPAGSGVRSERCVGVREVRVPD
jgi:hypothetical protein